MIYRYINDITLYCTICIAILYARPLPAKLIIAYQMPAEIATFHVRLTCMRMYIYLYIEITLEVLTLYHANTHEAREEVPQLWNGILHAVCNSPVGCRYFLDGYRYIIDYYKQINLRYLAITRVDKKES